MINKNSERGQALVLIVFAIIGLMGMAALAIDIGQLYSARRNAQNAADAAALAAAYDASAGSKDAATAMAIAFDSAKDNGYSNADSPNVVVTVNNPPVDSPYCDACEGIINGKEYFQVKIRVRLQPIFSQFIFSGFKETTVEAVAHAAEADEMSAGNALMALNEDQGDAMNLDGNVKIIISGGNMRSNGGMQKKGGSGEIEVKSPAEVYYADSFSGKLGPFTDATPRQQTAAAIGKFDPPACPTLANAAGWSSAGGVKYKADTTYGATTYVHPNTLGSGELQPGIHCLYNGISLTGNGELTGSDVLIVLVSGDVKMVGNSTFTLSAATDMKDMNGNQWGGLVFYAPRSNAASLRWGGTDGGYFYGVVFAPASVCDIGGTPDGSAIHSAIICDTIKVHGNPNLVIQYVPEELFHFPPLVELVQ